MELEEDGQARALWAPQIRAPANLPVVSFFLFLALEGRGTGQQKVGIGLFHRGTSAGRKMNGRRLAVFRVAYGCMDTPTDTTGPTLTCRFFRSRTDLSLASNSRSRWQSHEAEQAYLPTFFRHIHILPGVHGAVSFLVLP